MALLSDIKARIDAYLLIKDDKEVLSVATCQGGPDEFVLHLADIWDGPIGANPFTGRDSLHIPKRQEPSCPVNAAPPDYGSVRARVEERMYGLMPGWFEMLDGTFDPEGPDPHVAAITGILLQDPSKDLDDIIHEYFKDTWFAAHGDGESW